MLAQSTHLVIDGARIWFHWVYVKNPSRLLEKIEMGAESEEQRGSHGCHFLSLVS